MKQGKVLMAFYRYMSEAEAEAVGKTGLLRGGRPGRTYWTDRRYESAREAKSLLALRARPEKGAG